MTVIFKDGFESGNFGAWTSTSTSAGEIVSVVTTSPHHGNCNMSAVTDGSTTEMTGEVA